jgi:hypothetical protein
VRAGVAVCAAALGCLASSPLAHGTGLTGLSDQHLQDWAPATGTYAATVASRLPQARYTTAWDVALHADDVPCAVACQRFDELTRWIAAASELGKRVVVSFDHAPGCDHAAPGCPPPTPAAYARAVRAFRERFPTVSEFTAWNEPNHHMRGTDGVDSNPASDPARAAAYWNVLDGACSVPSATGGTCLVAAGDVLDGPGSKVGAYTRAYERALAAPPRVWAVHPYTAVNRGDRTGLGAFMAATGAAPVWFTEVGAYRCVADTSYGDGGQNVAANRLVSVMSAFAWRVTRTYYYQLRDTSGCVFDSGLLAPAGDVPRPALATLLPDAAAPFGAMLALAPPAVGAGNADRQALVG